jgi:hypothetical protein
MIPPSRAFPTSKFLPLLAFLLCIGALASPAAAGAAEGTVTYTRESFQEYEKQLAAAEIKSVTINKKVRSVHITLKDGRHVLAKYAAHEEPKVASALEAKGVPVSILSKAAADQEAKKGVVHHKLRYIAGGILIAVIVVVGGVLLWDRRRKALRD